MPGQVENCENCKYHLPLVSSNQDHKGLCRFEPPKRVLNRIEIAVDDGRWSLCFATEWCGKWSKKT